MHGSRQRLGQLNRTATKLWQYTPCSQCWFYSSPPHVFCSQRWNTRRRDSQVYIDIINGFWRSVLRVAAHGRWSSKYWLCALVPIGEVLCDLRMRDANEMCIVRESYQQVCQSLRCKRQLAATLSLLRTKPGTAKQPLSAMGKIASLMVT